MDLGLISQLVGDNVILLSLLAGIFAGETVILTLSTIISSTNSSLIWQVLIFSYIGELIAEFFFFFLGRTKLIYQLNKIQKFRSGLKKSGKIIDKLTDKSVLKTLFYSKFIYGVRTLTVIYLGYKRTSWKNFIKTELIVMGMAVSLVVAIGYFIGQGYKIALYLFRSFKIAMTIVFILFFVYYLLNKRIYRMLDEYKKKKR